MNGGSVHYHLRTNKAIERDIFFELLLQLKLENSIKNYRYISLGGPTLEDFRLLHQKTGMTNLLSLEKDSATISRQYFNKPFSCIDCKKINTTEFILSYEANYPTVMWLDYVDTKWSAQFEDCYSILSKLNAYDILKVTFNANPGVLSDGTDEKKLATFIDKAGSNYTSLNLNINDIKTLPSFANTIASIFQTVCDAALTAVDELVFHPLTMFRYIDNKHQMLAITGIVLPEKHSMNNQDLIDIPNLSEWPFLCDGFSDVHEIQVPDLSLKERNYLNALLPDRANTLLTNELPFKIFRNPNKNQKALENYIKYYRYIPNFQRLAI